MFSNIGYKIKVLAQVLFGIGVVGAVIAGFVVMGLGNVGIGFAIMGGGFLLFWVGSLSLYGYGELIDQTMITASLAQQQLTALHSAVEGLSAARYSHAVALMEAEKYNAAYALLAGLHVQDSEAKLQEVMAKQMLSAQVGDMVRFGTYPQGNRASDGKKAIEWLVLAKENGRMLLVSKYALNCKKYHTTKTKVTWETSSLREWLNGTFLNEAFNATEQGRIATSTVAADRNPKYDTDPGQATEDKVFLLSVVEAERYFTTNAAWQCAPTAYAIAQGVYVSDSYTTADGAAACWWWLRSPGCNQDWAARVDTAGELLFKGYSVHSSHDGVRPALWVKTSSLKVQNNA